MTEKKRTVRQILSLIERAEEKKEKYMRDCKDLENELFETCTHPKDETLEGEWKRMEWGDSFPPFRVCKPCGYAEEGWGTGYQKLNYDSNEILHVKREEAERYIRWFFSQEKLKEQGA